MGRDWLARVVVAVPVLVGFSACANGVDQNGSEHEASVSSVVEELYYLSTSLWDHRDVSVCWTFSGFATEKEWVRAALSGQRSWSSAGSINFVGWESCGTADIRISNGANAVSGGLGQHSGASTVALDFGTSLNYSRCTSNGLDREHCIKATALHEFGHLAGYAHEQNRGNVPAECTSSSPQGSNGDATYGSFDVRSITAYCNFSTNLSIVDRRGTERLYGPRLGDTPALGDFNGDGLGDLMCRDVLSGQTWLDYANTAFEYAGTNWNGNSGWCNATEYRRVLQGDFNGDSRTDLLCFDLLDGLVGIDYANSSGQFGGTDWTASSGWCNGGEDRGLYVGDFNGDGRDDLYCHARTSGDQWIDLANSSGEFGNNDWSASIGWCNASANRRTAIGDFNADGRDDIFCYDVGNGFKATDLASSSGTFNGADWQVTNGWCDAAGSALYFGDFNGDGRTDLLCHSAGGNREIDFASSSGTFGSTDYNANNSWCDDNGSRLFVGDVNGDGRDDLVCHNLDSGTRWVDYASSSGQLSGTNFTVTGNWCNNDANELL